MSITHDTTDRLLTEVERQTKYLAKRPEDFSFPLFNAAQALESQRRSGYRNTAAAAREIVAKSCPYSAVNDAQWLKRSGSLARPFSMECCCTNNMRLCQVCARTSWNEVLKGSILSGKTNALVQ